jgi:4-hydroxyacetophenone monooxygenase
MVNCGIGTIEVRPEVYGDYARRQDEAHARMIWSHPAMRNWYRNAVGRVISALPWRIVDYWEMTRRVRWDDFTVEPAR